MNDRKISEEVLYELDKVYNVLDKGFVQLVSIDPSFYTEFDRLKIESIIVNAARVSYANHNNTTKTVEDDKKLISYLLKNHHDSPLEFITLKFHIKCPIFIARQWFRHRTFSFNEISGRYVQLKEEFYIPSRMNKQSKLNKQGSSEEEIEDKEQVIMSIETMYNNIYKCYKELLNKGLSKELARIILPVGTYTEFYFSSNLRNLLHFLDLRNDNHAQYEIREYAKIIEKILEHLLPITLSAYKNK